MPRVRRKQTKNQRREVPSVQQAIPLDDGTVTTPTALAMIQALIPLGLRAVEEASLPKSRFWRGRDMLATMSIPMSCAGVLSAGRSISRIKSFQ
jgi:hypothetical protein